MSYGSVLAYSAIGILSLHLVGGCAESETAEGVRQNEREKTPIETVEEASPESKMRFVTVNDAEKNCPLAMEGCCAISLHNDGSWIGGDKNFGVVHRGRLFLFTNSENQTKFLGNPDAYSPALMGSDAVVFAIKGVLRDGNRDNMVNYQGRTFLFVDSTSKADFEKSPQVFAEFAALAEKPRPR